MHRTRIFLPLITAALACAAGGPVVAGEVTAAPPAARTEASTATRATVPPATAVSKSEVAAATDEKELAKAAHDVDAAAGQGERAVAGRLAGEFGMTTDALLAEQERLDASWGQLMIAHSLAANSAAGTTAEQLLARREAGEGWGRIAADLGLEMGAVVRGVTEERGVALGHVKADGRVVPMRGAGARADAGVKANTNAGVGLAKGAAAGASVGTSVGASAGVGLGVGHAKNGK